MGGPYEDMAKMGEEAARRMKNEKARKKRKSQSAKHGRERAMERSAGMVIRQFIRENKAFAKWINFTFDIKRQERWYEKRKNETRAEQALRRLLTHFIGDAPEILVKRTYPGRVDGWIFSFVSDQAKDDVLFARRIMEKGVT